MSANDPQKKVFGMPYNVGIGVLCVLGAICLYEFYDNVIATPSYPTQNVARTAAPAGANNQPAIGVSSTDNPTRRPVGNQRRTEEFNPPFRAKRAEDRPDPNKIDPTLRLDLLSKVQTIDPPTGTRNLFQVSAAPPVKKTEVAALEGKGPVVLFKPIGPTPPPPPPPPPGPPPPPTLIPIPLKFYGFTIIKGTGLKTAYFMDGDDILMAREDEVVKRRYKVIRINATSVVMEDIDAKRQQTIPLTADETQG